MCVVWLGVLTGLTTTFTELVLKFNRSRFRIALGGGILELISRTQLRWNRNGFAWMCSSWLWLQRGIYARLHSVVE